MEEQSNLLEWCTTMGFPEIYRKLVHIGYNRMEQFTCLFPKDISDLCDYLELKFGRKADFIIAIRDYNRQAILGVYSRYDIDKKNQDSKHMLEEWCHKKRFFPGCHTELVKLGFTSLEQLVYLFEHDLDDICEKLGLKWGKKADFRLAVKEYSTRYQIRVIVNEHYNCSTIKIL